MALEPDCKPVSFALFFPSLSIQALSVSCETSTQARRHSKDRPAHTTAGHFSAKWGLDISSLRPRWKPQITLKQKQMSWFISFHSLEPAFPQSQQLNYLHPNTLDWIHCLLPSRLQPPFLQHFQILFLNVCYENLHMLSSSKVEK